MVVYQQLDIRLTRLLWAMSAALGYENPYAGNIIRDILHKPEPHVVYQSDHHFRKKWG